MNTPDLLNRRGRFAISETFVRENPEAVMEVMGQCVVVRCQMRYERTDFEYFAVSPQFEVTDGCMAPPEYKAQFELVNVGTKEAPVTEAKFIGFVPATNS